MEVDDEDDERITKIAKLISDVVYNNILLDEITQNRLVPAGILSVDDLSTTYGKYIDQSTVWDILFRKITNPEPTTMEPTFTIVENKSQPVVNKTRKGLNYNIPPNDLTSLHLILSKHIRYPTFRRMELILGTEYAEKYKAAIENLDKSCEIDIYRSERTKEKWSSSSMLNIYTLFVEVISGNYGTGELWKAYKTWYCINHRHKSIPTKTTIQHTEPAVTKSNLLKESGIWLIRPVDEALWRSSLVGASKELIKQVNMLIKQSKMFYECMRNKNILRLMKKRKPTRYSQSLKVISVNNLKLCAYLKGLAFKTKK